MRALASTTSKPRLIRYNLQNSVSCPAMSKTDELETRVKQLENEVANLKALIAQLQATIRDLKVYTGFTRPHEPF